MIDRYRHEFSILWVEGIPDSKVEEGFRRTKVGRMFSFDSESRAYEKRAFFTNPNNDWLPAGAGDLVVSDIHRVRVGSQDDVAA